jgi:hypothetical protein
MHLCKDCTQYQEATGYCLRTSHADPVTGNPKYYYARIEREYQLASGCGMGAQFFTPMRLPLYSFDDLDDLSKIPFGR